MRIEEKEIQAAMNRRLSGLDASSVRRAHIRQRIAQEEARLKIQHKVSVALVLALILMLAAFSALAAAGILFSPQLNAASLADSALEKAYGVNRTLQTYFNRSVEERADGITLVRYTGIGGFEFVLGEYTVTIQGNKVKTVQWSHDGESTEGGFEADAWGINQLKEMLRINRETYRMSPFQEIAEEKARAHGVLDEAMAFQEPTEEEIQEEIRQWKAMQEAIRSQSQCSENDLAAIAVEGIAVAYDLTEEQKGMLERLDEGDYLFLNDKPCFRLFVFLNQRADPEDPFADVEWTEKDGTYVVWINVENGTIEEIVYNSGLGGNG